MCLHEYSFKSSCIYKLTASVHVDSFIEHKSACSYTASILPEHKSACI